MIPSAADPGPLAPARVRPGRSGIGPQPDSPLASTAVSAADLEVLADLRRARRKQRVAAIHWVDALYQVYITAILAIVAVVFLSGLTGDGDLDAAGLAKVVDHGPALIGTIASLALLIGLRS